MHWFNAFFLNVKTFMYYIFYNVVMFNTDSIRKYRKSVRACVGTRHAHRCTMYIRSSPNAGMYTLPLFPNFQVLSVLQENTKHHTWCILVILLETILCTVKVIRQWSFSELCIVASKASMLSLIQIVSENWEIKEVCTCLS